jgi:hypothetical protein
MNPMDNPITLDADSYGIWLVEQTTEGPVHVGHVSWAIIAAYIKEYL